MATTDRLPPPDPDSRDEPDSARARGRDSDDEPRSVPPRAVPGRESPPSGGHWFGRRFRQGVVALLAASPIGVAVWDRVSPEDGPRDAFGLLPTDGTKAAKAQRELEAGLRKMTLPELLEELKKTKEELSMVNDAILSLAPNPVVQRSVNSLKEDWKNLALKVKLIEKIMLERFSYDAQAHLQAELALPPADAKKLGYSLERKDNKTVTITTAPGKKYGDDFLIYVGPKNAANLTQVADEDAKDSGGGTFTIAVPEEDIQIRLRINDNGKWGLTPPRFFNKK